MTDVAAAALQAFASGLMAVLGVWMTIHPPETERSKNGYKRAFLGLAALAVLVSAWQGFRSFRAGNALEATLSRIEQLTAETKRQSDRPIEVTKFPPISLIYPSPAVAPGLAQVTRPTVPAVRSDKNLAVRNRLAALLNEGVRVRELFRSEEEKTAIEAAVKWDADVRTYIEANLEPAYAARWGRQFFSVSFRAGTDNWSAVINRIDMLDEFIRELRD